MKVAEIKKCGDKCPHYVFVFGLFEGCCGGPGRGSHVDKIDHPDNIVDRIISESVLFPEWCPLQEI